MTFKEAFISMISGPSGGISSKRVITLFAFVLCAITFVAGTFFEIPIKDFLWYGMLGLVTAGLGVNTVEHFSRRLK